MYQDNRVEIKVRNNDSHLTDVPLLNAWIVLTDETGRVTEVAQPITVEKLPAGVEILPTMQLPLPAAQKLMDQLWECGLRPAQSDTSPLLTAATERHLRDLREILFSQMKIMEQWNGRR